MRFTIISLSILSQLTFAASEITTKIFGVEEVDGHANILSLVDGKVYSLDLTKAEILSTLKIAIKTKASIKLSLSNDGESIHSIELLEANDLELETLGEKIKASSKERRLSDYIPTTISSMNRATELFESVFQYKEDDGFDLNDNCYNRAHYWSRAMYVQDKLKSQKVFIFFTEKYRREHKYKWWYHVAPFVLVGSTKKEVVLDMSFTDEPYTMKEWAEEFADKAKKKCYNGKNLSDYHGKTNTEDCVLVRASMYHYSPNDLEDNGSKMDWSCSDLKSVTRSIPGPNKKPWSAAKGFLPSNCR